MTDPMQFLDILDSSLSEAELGTLCRQFGVAYSAFPGATKRDKTREFLGYIRRQGRMAGLAEATVALRPDLTKPVAQLFESKEQDLAWLDQVAGGDGGVMDSGLTWRWSASSGARMVNTDLPTQPPPAVGPPGETGEPSLPDVPENPYSPGRKVADDAMFFGRRLEREQARAYLMDRAHVAIVSGRGFGGSSLLHSIARALSDEKRFLVAFVEMKNPAYYTLPSLLNMIWTQWWAQVKPGTSVLVTTLAEFVTAVRKLNSAGFRPLLFLDELEQLVWRPSVFEDNLYNAWHELGHEGLLGFAVSAHAPVADLMAQAELSSKFHELFQQLSLGLLDETAARDVLTVPSEAAGLSIPDGAVDHLLAQAGPHPFFLHLAGLYIFSALSRGTYSRSAVSEQFEAAAEPYWQEIWDSLSPLAQEHYPADYARITDGMAGRQLRILANKGFVIADERGFQPLSKGFAGWVRRMRAATESAAAAVAGPEPL